MASPLRRSVLGSKTTNKVAPSSDPAPLIPTNELIVKDWMSHMSKQSDIFLVKLVEEMPKWTKEKKKKGSKKGKKKNLYPGKLKMKTCPHAVFNMYCPGPVVDKFLENHQAVEKDCLTSLFVYKKYSANDLQFVGEITCNSHPMTPQTFLDNGVFVVNDNTKLDGLSIMTTGERDRVVEMGTPPPWNPKKFNTALTFYELRWFMDHPYFITLVLTVIADHTVMVVKKKKDEPVKKPKATSFIGKDYNSHLEDLMKKLCKSLVFMTRKINTDKFDSENEELVTSIKATLSLKRASYPDQAPFTLHPINTSCFQPKPLKRQKLNPRFSTGRVVHTTVMPMKINEDRLRQLVERRASLANTV